MKTDKELLLLAGRLATASENLLKSDILSIGYRATKLSIALDEYNNAIYERANEEEK